MKKIDIRLKKQEAQRLSRLIGKQIISIEHDPFIFTNTSSQIVQINTTDEVFYVYNFTEPNDYYGAQEDVGVMSVETTRYPAVDSKDFIRMPVGDKVRKIVIVQERQQLFDHSEQIYEVMLTRGIIIDFGTYQISFEKAVWFSEDIVVRKGYSLIDEFKSPSQICREGNWEDGLEMKCDRICDVIES